MSTIDNPIIRIGSLYYIPVEDSDELIDLCDFADGEDTQYDEGAQFIEHSTAGDRHATSGQSYAVFQIIPARNGEMLILEDVINGELRRAYEYLREKGLVPLAEYPGIVASDPFTRVLQSH